MENAESNDPYESDNELDPYSLASEDIYDTLDENNCHNAAVLSRPPAPIPRPEIEPEPEKPVTYISRGTSHPNIAPSIIFLLVD